MGRGVRIYIEHRVCCLNLRVCLRFIPTTPKAPTVLFLAGKRDYCIRYHMSVEHQLVNADELIGHMHGARNSGLFAAERNRIGECARLSSAAD